MSGGVDSAVAALLVSRATGAQAVAVTLELWSDPENDGELSCCSAQAVRGARELAHGLGMPHLSIDLRAEFRAGVVDRWLADHAAGPHAEPVRALQRQRAPRRDARARRAARRRRRSPPATTRASRSARAGPLLRTAADVGKDQSYVLSRARARVARAPALPARRAAQAARCASSRARRAWRWRAGATRRTSASSRARARSAFLERHGGLGARPGPIVDRDGRVLGEHAGAHVYTVGQRHGLGIGGAASRCTCSPPTRAPTPSRSARAQELLAREMRGARGDAAPRRRLRGRRARARARPPARLPPAQETLERGRHARVTRRARTSPPSAPRRASSPACTRASWSSATARSRPSAPDRTAAP